VYVKKFIYSLIVMILGILGVRAESASLNFSVELPGYFQISNLTSPVLNAHITDKTGTLYSPLYSKFRVISNISDEKTIYLKAITTTENGVEEAMFDQNGRVYIAFSNIISKPKSDALANCKYGSNPNASPGVVAYPVSSIVGVKHRYLRGRGKYEIYINNGITDISVNIGTHVLKNSFGENDPKGFYQATLLLTEADI